MSSDKKRGIDYLFVLVSLAELRSDEHKPLERELREIDVGGSFHVDHYNHVTKIAGNLKNLFRFCRE